MWPHIHRLEELRGKHTHLRALVVGVAGAKKLTHEPANARDPNTYLEICSFYAFRWGMVCRTIVR